MKSFLKIFLISAILFTSCNRVTEKAKETINKGGEAVGETATEFFEGVSEGVEKTLECEIIISQDLKNKGIKTGSFSIENKTSGGENNLLTLYLIFEKDFSSTLTAKAFNKNELEIGRTKIDVKGLAGEAKYFDFEFDNRTYIGVRNKIIIE